MFHISFNVDKISILLIGEKMGFDSSKIFNYIKGDELYTPKNAIIPLIKYIPENAIVWECAEKISMDGNITSEIRNSGRKVITTSIHHGIDFLTSEVPEGVTHIITNPPFSIKDKFLARCYQIGLPFALLLPTNTIDTKTRFVYYKKYGLEMLVFDTRVKYIGSNDRPPFTSSWFCWNILPEKLIFEELK